MFHAPGRGTLVKAVRADPAQFGRHGRLVAPSLEFGPVSLECR